MTNKLLNFFALGIVCCLFAVSCSKAPERPADMPAPQPTVVYVKQDGKALEKASVTLIPADPSNNRWFAGGETDSGGKAIIYTLSKYNGAVPGRYKVTVGKTETLGGNSTFVDPNEDPEGYAKMMENSAKAKPPETFDLVDPKYGSESTTPEEAEIVAGKNETTIDVGPAIRKKRGR